MRTRTLSVAAAATTLLVAGLSSQGRGGNANEWPTAYGDAQHSSWIRSDASMRGVNYFCRSATTISAGEGTANEPAHPLARLG